MIRIELQKAEKKFTHQWIFRDLNLKIDGPGYTALLGHNGSGKSTLLQVLAGYQSLTAGSINFYQEDRKIPNEDWHDFLSLAAPYLDLPEEYRLSELLGFYMGFKSFRHDIHETEILEITGLQEHRDKPVKYFSSGMKQRLKLGLAILCDTPVLLLDEPLSNLDKNGAIWYRGLMENYTSGKTVLICSNHFEEETFCCDKFFDMELINGLKVQD